MYAIRTTFSARVIVFGVVIFVVSGEAVQFMKP
jgi:hypothetical protein